MRKKVEGMEATGPCWRLGLDCYLLPLLGTRLGDPCFGTAAKDPHGRDLRQPLLWLLYLLTYELLDLMK